MESQVMKIATGETEKSEVVDSTIELFKEKFFKFRENLSRCDRFFGVKSDSGSNFGGGGYFGGDRGGGYGGDRGGGYGGDRGGGFGGDRGGGRGFQGRGGGGGRGGGQGGGMVGRDGGGRGGGFGGQGARGGGRGGPPRFGAGRDNGRGGYSNKDSGGFRGGKGQSNFEQGGFENDFSHAAKRPSGERSEDHTKRFRGGENSHNQRQSQNQQRTPMQPPEGCSWW